MPKPKFYVVWKGIQPGIYGSWGECSLQIRGVAGAQYKSFATREEAERAFGQNPWEHIGRGEKATAPAVKKAVIPRRISECLCVDAAWNTETKVMEYRGVHLPTGREWFHSGPYADATNNIGEFLAIVHGLSLLDKSGSRIPVFSDSRTAIAWVRNRHAKTKLELTARNARLFDLISRAETWLINHPGHNDVYKWQTEDWGEIPADFGRK